MNRTIHELAASFAPLESVEALVLAGSTTTGLADEGSDYDLYAYTREAVPVEFRARLLKWRAARLELHNTFWEWSDEWTEPDGAAFDLMYRSCDLIEADVEGRLGRGEAYCGLLHLPVPLGAAGPAGVRSPRLVPCPPGPGQIDPLPEPACEGVIDKNLSVLGANIHSYEQ
jgi:hypothetical protein